MFLTKILLSSLLFIAGVSADCSQTTPVIRQSVFEENIYSTGCKLF